MSDSKFGLTNLFATLVNRGVRIGKNPSRILWAVFVLRDLSRLRRPNLSLINSFMKANRVEAITLEPKSSLPTIEALIVAARKDFEILGLCILSIGESSVNQIDRISIIVPHSDLEECQSLIVGLGINIPYQIIDEDSFLSVEIRDTIKRLFGKRYGWALQQVLTVEFIRKSQACGVLVVNSDTVLLSKMVWLDELHRQPLMPTWEYHKPYYDFLESLSPSFVGIKQSFISHHMLMQPVIFRETLTAIGIDSVKDLLREVEIHAELSDNSAVCLEFEIYAQGLLVFNSELALITKWSNVGLSRAKKSNLLAQIEKIRLDGHFRSVSIHSWS